MDNNAFQNASLTLINDAYNYVTSESKIVEDCRRSMSSEWFAREFRTLRISSHRQAGHTTLINQLAFEVGSDIGRRYSTIVMAPTPERARYNFMPENIYYSREDESINIIEQLGQEYANEYRNIVRSACSQSGGKVLTASCFDHIGFNTRSYMLAQRKAIFELTGKEVDKFDLMLIDGVSDIRPQTLDKIVINFMDSVELFVMFQ